MCTCEFCKREFQPRPQVKNPRACKECQAARQRDNEYNWKERHKDIYNKEYYEQQKIKREDEKKKYADELIECLEVGMKFLEKKLRIGEFRNFIMHIFSHLGLTKIKQVLEVKKE